MSCPSPCPLCDGGPEPHPPCRRCNGPNDTAELCEKCGEEMKAEGYDPFFTADNCGKDLK